MPTLSYLGSHIRVCPSQVACDGSTLIGDREVCGPCAKRLESRKKNVTKPLRGERCVAYMAEKKRAR
jgi:hypothetical protein